jgi:predicted metalloprotease
MRLIALTIAAVVALACGVMPNEPQTDPTTTPTTPPGQQEDGTMTVEEFRGDINTAVSLAEEYWQERFRDSGIRFEPIGRVIAYEQEGEVACGRQPIPENNAAYCPDGDFIAYDVDWAVVAFRRIGDAFLFYLLGHEYAHGIQIRLGIDYEYTIQQELQADCMAGAYIGDTIKAGKLRLDKGDLEEFQKGLLAVGDDPDQPWFAPDAHGTADQRTDSFFKGYEKSIGACGLQ